MLTDYLNDYSTKKGEEWLPGEREYLAHINRTITKQLTLSSDYVRGMERSILDRREFMDKLTPQIDKLIYSSGRKTDDYITNFYNVGKDLGYSQMKVASFMGESDKHALRYLRDYNFELIKNLSQDLELGTRRMVWEGLAKGDGIPEIAKRIENLNSLPPLTTSTGRTITTEQRAVMIARTETMRAQNQGTLLSYEQRGIEKIIVIVTDDEATCDECGSLPDGNPYTTGDNDFPDLPLHPQCRCTYAPYNEPLDEAIDLDSYYSLVEGMEVNIT